MTPVRMIIDCDQFTDLPVKINLYWGFPPRWTRRVRVPHRTYKFQRRFISTASNQACINGSTARYPRDEVFRPLSSVGRPIEPYPEVLPSIHDDLHGDVRLQRSPRPVTTGEHNGPQIFTQLRRTKNLKKQQHACN